MRNDKTHHPQTIRITNSGQVREDSPLNIALLWNLLRESIGIDDSEETPVQDAVTGKKRAGQDSSPTPRKKPKIEADRSSGHPYTTEEAELVPVFCHTFEFTFTKDEASDEGVVDDDTREHLVQDLETFLHQYYSTLDTKSHEFPNILTCIKDDAVHIYPSQRTSQDTLLALPPIAEVGFDLREDDYRTNAHYLRSVIYCCQVLHSAGRVNVSARLRIFPLPPNESILQNKLPVSIAVEVTVSLIIPAIFRASPKDVKFNADIERRVLNYVFPLDSTPPSAYHGETDIPFMYSALGPPPDLSPQISDAVQPAALTSTLLPFQRRSVAWMLRREGKTVNENGQISPLTELETPLFWERVELDDRVFYLHRLKGLLSPICPEGETKPGGSLNEPPGMGKTVECIALILLNPGIGRDPSIKWWDSESRVFVKQIKVSQAHLLKFDV